MRVMMRRALAESRPKRYRVSKLRLASPRRFHATVDSIIIRGEKCVTLLQHNIKSLSSEYLTTLREISPESSEHESRAAAENVITSNAGLSISCMHSPRDPRDASQATHSKVLRLW